MSDWQLQSDMGLRIGVEPTSQGNCVCYPRPPVVVVVVVVVFASVVSKVVY